MTENTTALALLPGRPLATVAELGEAIQRLSGAVNLLMPLARIDYIPPMHAISLRAVMLDHAVGQYGAGTDTYKSALFCKGEDERALSQTGILKLWSAAGGEIIESRRTDDGRDPNYCAWQVTGLIQQTDGKYARACRSREVDLRPGSPQLAAFKGKDGINERQLEQARSQIAALAESKATNRMMRAVLALRQKYTTAELAKPFVVPVLIFQPDPTDPATKRMMLEQHFRSANALYGPSAAHQLVDKTTGEVIDIPDAGGDDDPPATPIALAAPDLPPMLPMTDAELAQIPQDQVNGAPRTRWVARVNQHALALVAKLGEAAAAPEIARCLGDVDLRTANAGDLSVVGKLLAESVAKASAA